MKISGSIYEIWGGGLFLYIFSVLRPWLWTSVLFHFIFVSCSNLLLIYYLCYIFLSYFCFMFYIAFLFLVRFCCFLLLFIWLLLFFWFTPSFNYFRKQLCLNHDRFFNYSDFLSRNFSNRKRNVLGISLFKS